MRARRFLLVAGRTLGFIPFFLWELLLANLQVALEVVRPRHRMEPGIIRIPLRASSDLEITFFANLISLTPGTLTLGVAKDRSALYVHGLHVRSPDHFRQRLARLEDRLLKVTR